MGVNPMTRIWHSCFQMKKSGVTIEDLPVNKLHDWVISANADLYEAAQPYIVQLRTFCDW